MPVWLSNVSQIHNLFSITSLRPFQATSALTVYLLLPWPLYNPLQHAVISYSDVFPLYFPKSFPHQSSARGVYCRPFSSLLALLQICTSFKTFISSNHQCSASGLLQVLFPQNAFSFCTASSFSSCNLWKVLSASIPKADSPLRVLGGGVLRFKG